MHVIGQINVLDLISGHILCMKKDELGECFYAFALQLFLVTY